jgi:hypothetical protein
MGPVLLALLAEDLEERLDRLEMELELGGCTLLTEEELLSFESSCESGDC